MNREQKIGGYTGRGNCRNEKGFTVRTNLVVLCWLAAVAALFLAGCATGRDTVATKAEAAGMPYTVRKITLPEQKTVIPFTVRHARYRESFKEKGLPPAMTVIPYLEALADAGHTPFRVREGVLKREADGWYFIEWPATEPIEQSCIWEELYYVVDMRAVR